MIPTPPPPVPSEPVRLGQTQDLVSWPPCAELQIPRGDPKLSRAMSTNKRGGKATRIRAVPPASAHLRVQGRRGKKRRFRQGYIRGTEPPPPGRELRKAP